MDKQLDPINRHTIKPDKLGAEAFRFLEATGGNPVLVVPTPTGNWQEVGHGKHPPKPEHERLEFTGKIVGLLHDRFGDFEGFLLEELRSGRVIHLHSRHAGIAELAEQAWRFHITVSVFVDRHRREIPVRIVFREPSVR